MRKKTKKFFVLYVLFFGLLINLVSSGAQADPVQWVGNDHWYDTVDEDAINWLKANAIASTQQFNGLKGHLVTITSEAENQFLVDTFGADLRDRWIGGTQAAGAPEPGGGWMWVTGEFWDYTKWDPLEPNNTGGVENAIILTATAHWNDKKDSDNSHWIAGYVIEYEPTPLERIEALENQVEDLIQKIEEHSHTCLTGKGKGHNKIEAKTGPAIFPTTP